jgi:aldose 1-epimerase
VSLVLASGEWRAELRPEFGGVLASLTRDGIEVLRTMPSGSTDPLEAACFPLVPWCNRIRDARFAWQGEDIRLAANFPPEPHSLHGLGWQSPWRVTSAAGFKGSIAHSHDGGGAWPWAYEAEQRVRVGAQGCAITLDLTNRAATPMPCGLGLHPYFRRRSETRVRFAASGMLEVDHGLIPTGEIAEPGRFADWPAGAALPPRLVDHCFAGWDGTATIEDDLGAIHLTARGASFLHLYAPENGATLCLEPVSHAPDAPNRAPAEMTVLPPGCTASLTMRISAA